MTLCLAPSLDGWTYIGQYQHFHHRDHLWLLKVIHGYLQLLKRHQAQSQPCYLCCIWETWFFESIHQCSHGSQISICGNIRQDFVSLWSTFINEIWYLLMTDMWTNMWEEAELRVGIWHFKENFDQMPYRRENVSKLKYYKLHIRPMQWNPYSSESTISQNPYPPGQHLLSNHCPPNLPPPPPHTHTHHHW